MFISDWRGWVGGVEILIGNNYLQMEAIGAQNYKAYFKTAIIYVRTDLRVEKFWISLTREQSLNFNRQIAT